MCSGHVGGGTGVEGRETSNAKDDAVVIPQFSPTGPVLLDIASSLTLTEESKVIKVPCESGGL